ncbi:hypothetical protein EYZ11_006374 [Aspergillus tanneri]|nr:hypothetical protein EYZ11_006374 [Aspergillus tanneri]
MKVIVVGAGLGGLACAIACRRANLDVTVLEKSPEISPIGAGIQIPPNGARIMDELCLLPELLEKGTVVETIDIRRYADGKIITSMPSGEILIPEYGAPWIIIHRADYHEILLARAKALGAKIRLSATVKDVVYESPQVILAGGERIAGDVIIGADGLGSTIRNCILGEEHPPDETGDLAYRGTFSREQLESLADTDINHLCARMAITSWLGPKKHAVFYPLRGGKEYNLVLIRPDDMPLGVHNAWSDLVEVQHAYKGWDRT